MHSTLDSSVCSDCESASSEAKMSWLPGERGEEPGVQESQSSEEMGGQGQWLTPFLDNCAYSDNSIYM